MKDIVLREAEIVDLDAIAIGELYEKSKSSFVNSVITSLECGARLAKKKAELPHGHWLPWLETNAGVLGFYTPSTSAKLIKASNMASTSHLELQEAITISQKMWGNTKAEDKKKAKQERADKSAELATHYPPETSEFNLFNESMLTVLDGQPEQVDWVITDPPYSKQFLHVYEELSEVSNYVLKPGGSLLCMVGQSWLPEVIQSLCKHLTYHWTLAYLTPGGQATQIFPREVNTFWKPVLWFVKGEYPGGWIGDVTKSDVNDNDKSRHHWGQSESGMYDLMKRFVNPGDKVLDPFMGAGTTGIVALNIGANFIGYDIDKTAFNETLLRLNHVNKT